MIAKITKAYTRLYRDNGQLKAYVEWIDRKKRTGRTEGEATAPFTPAGTYMKALFMWAATEGVAVKHEVW